MVYAIVSRQGVAFQPIFQSVLAFPVLALSRINGSNSGKFTLGTELCLTKGGSIRQPGVELTISNHSQFQPPVSSRFTSLRQQV